MGDRQRTLDMETAHNHVRWRLRVASALANVAYIFMSHAAGRSAEHRGRNGGALFEHEFAVKFPGPVNPDEVPEWLRPGSTVIHNTFGKGVIKCYRVIKNGPAMEIEFERFTKVLSPEHGIPYLRPATDEPPNGNWFQRLLRRK